MKRFLLIFLQSSLILMHKHLVKYILPKAPCRTCWMQLKKKRFTIMKLHILM